MKKREKIWYITFLLLREFVNEKKRYPYSTEMYKGVNIGIWVDYQRQKIKEKNISYMQLKALKSINFPIDRMGYSEYLEIEWKQNIDLLEEYLLKNDKFPLPNTVYKNVELGKWFEKIQRDYTLKRMDAFKIEDLKRRNIYLSRSEYSWRSNYKNLGIFMALKKRLPTKPDDAKLALWLKNQLIKAENGSMSTEHLKLLQELGVFDMPKEDQPAVWDMMCSCYENYYNAYQKNPKSGTEYDSKQIGAWFKRQLKQYESGKMVERRINRLQEINPNIFDNIIVNKECNSSRINEDC